MTEKISFSDAAKGDFVSLFICSVAERAIKSGQATQTLELDFKINGIAIEAISFIKHIEEQMELMVKEKAIELCKEKMDEVVLGELEQIVASLNKAAHKVFNVPDEDEY